MEEKKNLICWKLIGSWQFVVILSVAAFWSPLYDTFKSLPDLLRNTESIEVGNTKIVISKRSVVQPSPEISNLLSKLDNESIKELIYFSKAESSTYSKIYYTADEKTKYENLVKTNMIEIEEHDSLVTIIKTKDGKKLQEFLFKLFFENIVTFEKK